MDFVNVKKIDLEKIVPKNNVHLVVQVMENVQKISNVNADKDGQEKNVHKKHVKRNVGKMEFVGTISATAKMDFQENSANINPVKMLVQIMGFAIKESASVLKDFSAQTVLRDIVQIIVHLMVLVQEPQIFYVNASKGGKEKIAQELYVNRDVEWIKFVIHFNFHLFVNVKQDGADQIAWRKNAQKIVGVIRTEFAKMVNVFVGVIGPENPVTF